VVVLVNCQDICHPTTSYATVLPELTSRAPGSRRFFVNSLDAKRLHYKSRHPHDPTSSFDVGSVVPRVS
jgi:hypothetical protein